MRDYHLMERVSFNCLERSALILCKRLKEVKALFEQRGFFCLMTGSGSAFFAIVRTNSIQRALRGQIKTLVHHRRDQGWLVCEAQTY